MGFPSSEAWSFLIGTFALIATIAVVGIVFARAHLRGHREIWNEYARRRGYRVEDAEGRWRARTGFGFSGVVGGVPFRLDRHLVHAGKHTQTYTRIRTRLAASVPARLLVKRRGVATRLAGWLMRDRVPIADAMLDGALVARCRNAEFATTLLATPAARRLADLPPNTSLRLEGDLVTVSRFRLVRDDAVLDRMLAITGEIGAVLGPRLDPTP